MTGKALWKFNTGSGTVGSPVTWEALIGVTCLTRSFLMIVMPAMMSCGIAIVTRE